MAPFDEELIEAFARRPTTLSAPDRARAMRLIDESEAAASLFTFFSTFYEEFDAVYPESMQFVEQFVRDLAPLPRRIQLVPRSDFMAGAKTLAKGTIVLVSEPDNGEVRIMLSPTNDHFRVYSLASDQDVVPHALLSTSGGHLKLNDAGRGTLETGEPSGETVLRPALHVASFAPADLLPVPALLIEGTRLRIRAGNSEFWVPPLEIDIVRPSFVAVSWDSGQKVLETGDVTVSIEEPIGRLTVSLYG